MFKLLGGGRRAAAGAMGGNGNGHRRNVSRRARSNVTYNEEILSEMARPLYYDYKGYAHRLCWLYSVDN